MKHYIIGDSWGRGEWVRGHISHKGLEQYFLDAGLKVKNLSKPGGALMDILDQVKRINNKEPCKVFCFITDTSRGIKDFWKSEWKTKDYLTRHNNTLKDYLHHYNERGVPIYLIGGMSAVNQEMIQGLDNIKIACPSMIELIIPDVELFDIYIQDKLNTLPFNMDRETLVWVMQQVDKWDTISNNKFFHTDRCHPDRHAFKILYQHLKDKNFI